MGDRGAVVNPTQPKLFEHQATMPPTKASTTRKQAEDFGPLFTGREAETPPLPLSPAGEK